MTCKSHENIIDKCIDGVITDEEMENLKEHIKDCADCRREVKQLQQIVKGVSALGQVDLPPDFTYDLMKKIENIASEKKIKTGLKGLVKFPRNVLIHISNFFHYRKKPFVAVSGILIVGVLMVSAYNSGFFSMRFDAKSAGEEASYRSSMAPTSEEMGYDVSQTAPAEGPGLMLNAENNFKESIKGESFDVSASAKQMLKDQGEFSTKERTQKIIKNAHMTIYVEKFHEKVDEIIYIVDDLGGYIENSQIEGSESKDSSRRAYMTFRIPQAKLTGALDMFKAMGDVSSLQMGGENITDAYFDTDARVRNLDMQEHRLLEILNMANNVDELLLVENELNRVRTETDMLRGQIAAWDKMVEMSLVDLHIIETRPSKEEFATITFPELALKVKQNFISMVNLTINILAFSVEALGVLLPIIIVGWVLFKGMQLIGKVLLKNKKKG